MIFRKLFLNAFFKYFRNMPHDRNSSTITGVFHGAFAFMDWSYPGLFSIRTAVTTQYGVIKHNSETASKNIISILKQSTVKIKIISIRFT